MDSLCSSRIWCRDWLWAIYASVYSRSIAGTPAVVIRMILYYIVFGKANIN